MKTRYTLTFFALCTFFALFQAKGGEPLMSTNCSPTNAIVLPEVIPDPLERINRGLWLANDVALKAAVKPSAKVYRTLMPVPFRMGVSNVGQNIQFPRRVINNLLQERWTGARDEVYRFLCNSVLGMGGFLNVASEFRIAPSEADFGQSFGKWGWNQNFYVMIPLMGPSSDRDAVGAALDAMANPLAFFSPYSWIPVGIRYNDLTDAVNGYVRRIDSEMDAYSLIRYGGALLRKQRPVDWELHGEQDVASLETIQTALFSFRDPHFPERGKNRTVKIPGLGRDFPYTAWLQATSAPIIYLLPGIGSHRLNPGALGLAELLYQRGFSVVTISSAYNFEFIERGLTADLPGYAISDVKDIHTVLTQIDHQLEREHPGKLGKRGLMGYSMGGFHTLFLAAHAAEDRSRLQFDRYLAIDPPVRLMHAIRQLDSLYNAALEWPAAERTDRIEQLLMKTAALATGEANGRIQDPKLLVKTTTVPSDQAAMPSAAPPLNSTESRFLIGLAFRLNLRDLIFFTQLRHDQGVLKQPITKWKREPVYREIMQYSFNDYLEKFIDPYYRARGIDVLHTEARDPIVDLRCCEVTYQSQDSVRVIANENDILLAPEDVVWLEQTFGHKLTLFSHGGHLGNLADTAVQVAIVNAFADLRQPEGRSVGRHERSSTDKGLIAAKRGLNR